MSAPQTSKIFFGLNGDVPLNAPRKVAWLGANALSAAGGELRALRPGPVAPVSPAEFAGTGLAWEEPTGRASLASSPGRLLTMHTTIAACRRLGGADVPLHVLDLGCGTGGFLPFFRDQLAGFAGYTGVDVQRRPQWEELSAPDATFVEAPAEQFVDALTPDAPHNVIHTSSALEHMPGDLHVLRRVAAWARERGEPVAHIHSVPASAGLALYRTHGYRVYSTTDVARLVEALGADPVTVVAIGGRRSWKLHLREIDHRDADPEGYAQRLAAAVAHDVGERPRLPIMWCLVSIPPAWDAGPGGPA